MKKLIAILIALTLCGAFAACGSNDTEAAAEPAQTEPAQTEPAQTEPAQTEQAASDTEATEGALDEETMTALRSVVTVNYLGLAKANEPVVLCANDDVSFAILAIANSDSNTSVCEVGPVTEDSNGMLTITNESAGETLTFSVTDNKDGTITLDLGDLGSCTLVPCTQEEALDALQTIVTHTTPAA